MKEKEIIQIIGADLGRGYIDGCTNFNGGNSCNFKAVVGQGRNMNFDEYENHMDMDIDLDSKEYENPIYIEVDGDDFFCGLLAEKEGDTITANSKDDKTSKTAKKLLYALLNELAVADIVKIIIGVPHKMFSKATLKDVKDAYLDKTIKITNKIDGKSKTVTIADIGIYRESDAALLYTTSIADERKKLEQKVIGMVTIGFRTTELTFFDKGMKYIDSMSTTLEKTGTITVLDYIRKQIVKDGIIKNNSAIDSSTDYDDLKKKGYENLIEDIDQSIESLWVNWREMIIFIAGGTSLNITDEDMPNKFTRVDDPQMVTAKGLNLVGEKVFENGKKRN